MQSCERDVHCAIINALSRKVSMMAEVQTICPYCGVGCGLFLITQGNTVTGVKPDKEHPVSKGTLCPKGATAHQFVNHPDRLTSPLLNKSGHFVEVSWDVAYDFIEIG